MRFIRKNGRVIPIRDKKEALKGSALVTAGVGVSIAGGGAYKKAVKTSEKYIQKAVTSFPSRVRKGTQLSFDDLIRNEAAKKTSAKFMRRALNFEKATPFIRSGSISAGSALIAYGAAKLVNSFSKKKNDRVKQLTAASTAGAISAVAFSSLANPKSVSKLLSRVIRKL